MANEKVKPSRGDIISFQLVQNGVIGDERVEVKVAGILDYEIARKIDPELARKHVNLYPYFKEKVNNIDDPSIYGYISVVGRNGESEIIGLPWIQDSTYKVIDGRIATMSIDNWREDFRAPIQTFMANLGANIVINVQDK